MAVKVKGRKCKVLLVSHVVLVVTPRARNTSCRKMVSVNRWKLLTKIERSWNYSNNNNNNCPTDHSERRSVGRFSVPA